MAKRDFLINIENTYKESILAPQSLISNDGDKKYFATFPVPYANGCLTLGHGFTIMSVDLQTRYKKSKGFNVMFPFGFHGSGMPIYATAKKLEREIELGWLTNITDETYNSFPKETQIGILKNMGVKLEDIPKFIDPTFWVPYFSEIAKKDLKDLHVYTDLTRTFFTTNTNPYYDSFIRWQFSHLIEMGIVYKGTRNNIFSIKDNQPCADHDRQTGEGVKPLKINCKLVKIGDCNILVTVTNHNDSGVIITPCDEFRKFTIDGICYISNLYSFKNISHQYDVTNIETMNFNQLKELDKLNERIVHTDQKINYHRTGFYLTVENNDQIEYTYDPEYKADFIYEEPEFHVVSRTVDICIVAKNDQWLINYGSESLKEPVRQYVKSHLQTNSNIVKKQFETSVEWLNEWPCSRNYGLGTFIPGTTDLIDSLSDSTIYMAYYTICHLITLLPTNILSNELWDYVFLPLKELDIYSKRLREATLLCPHNSNYNFTTNDENYDKIINEMKKEFQYWYPLDLRVSGKDLINNHLTMALFNHQAIWEDSNFFPQRYSVNGYLMLNGEKMSKSTGNFLTIRDTLEKFGTNSTRLSLINSFGNDTDDGNFETEYASGAVVKLYREIDFISTIDTIADGNNVNESSIWGEIFKSEIINYVKMAETSYESMKYKGIILCFDGLINAKNEYIKMSTLCNLNLKKDILENYINAIVTIMEPALPTWICQIQSIYPNLKSNWNLEQKMILSSECNKYKYFKHIIQNVSSDCFKLISKSKNPVQSVQIKVFTKFTDDELNLINNIDTIDEYLNLMPKIETSDKVKYGKSKNFTTYVQKKILEYGTSWIDWTTKCNEEEFKMIRLYMPLIVKNCKVVQIEPEEKFKFNNGPNYPFVSKG